MKSGNGVAAAATTRKINGAHRRYQHKAKTSKA